MKRSLANLPLVALLLAACSEAPEPVAENALVFAGTVRFEDELAGIETGSVFVNVYDRRGDPIPAYCRKYDVGDPAFREEGDALVLSFAVDETHNMAGTGVPLGGDPQLEVRYDPDGHVETKDGVRSTWTAAQSGTTGLTLVLDASAEAPEAAPTSRPASRPTLQPTSRPAD